jgi:UDP-N-acetylglucosamine 1-carboxyvinyltransferase
MKAMRQYRITGGNRLSGEMYVGGAKNAVLPMFAAVCLTESEVLIHNCPRIDDVLVSIEILRSIGCKVEFVGDTVVVNSFGELGYKIPD